MGSVPIIKIAKELYEAVWTLAMECSKDNSSFDLGQRFGAQPLVKKEFDLLIIGGWLATIPVGRMFIPKDSEAICDKIFYSILDNYKNFEEKMKLKRSNYGFPLGTLIKDRDEISLIYRNKEIDVTTMTTLCTVFGDIALKRMFDYNTTYEKGKAPDVEKLVGYFFKHTFGEKLEKLEDKTLYLVNWSGFFFGSLKVYFDIVNKK